eukprot:TRINITY_DN5027_c4_g1_i1.p1 TRINITY_DN5027_c4_g1~~TRINITY_DN5027_c4_g1_i1.p1  ORF type:complete len:718 (+),score=227.16 TRINITY_DN5027_c4_g1_i1:68-2155(+)
MAGATVTREEVGRHNKRGDIWVILKHKDGSEKVYDLTAFIEEHPGGVGALLAHAGKDATEDFLAIHDWEVLVQNSDKVRFIGLVGAVTKGLVQPAPAAAGAEYQAGWGKEDAAAGRTSTSVGDDVDVVVVGSGAAGASAALGALVRGARKVLVLEKSGNMAGGTTRLAGGGWVWFPNNKFLTDAGVRQPDEAVVALLKELAYPQAEGVEADPRDVECMRTFAKEAPGVINTMIDRKFLKVNQVKVKTPEDEEKAKELLQKRAALHGPGAAGLTPERIEKLSRLMPSYCGDNPLDLVPVGNVLAGGSTAKQLLKALESFGGRAEVRMGCQVEDIVTDPSGAVVGVRYRVMRVNKQRVTRSATREKMFAVEPTDEVRTVRAKGGVIFASGGFSNSADLLKEAELPISGTCACPTNTGDFVSIARRHNIPVGNIQLAWVKQVVMPFNELRTGVFFLNADSFIVVDRNGRRYANEKNFYQQRGLQMRANLRDRRFVFFIFDGRSRRLFEGPLKGLGGPIPLKQQEKDCLIQRQPTVAALGGAIRRKLAEVAPDYQVDADFDRTLAAQIERFNDGARKGVDADRLGRDQSYAEYCWHVPRAADNKYPNKMFHPIDTSDLCCVILGLSTLDTKAGPRTDGSARVLSAEGAPVPGLYAAGNAAHAWSRNSYPASGATIASAITFGYVAGREAAARTLPASRL